MLRLICIIGLAGIFSCEVKPTEINYGIDGCHFCKMTIVDKQHAAQLVTVKGKAFKYDAIECMMNDLSTWDGPDIQYYLTNDYASPGSLIDAQKASFLISEAIPSPMGAFLSAFENPGVRDQTLVTRGGQALSWADLKNKFH